MKTILFSIIAVAGLITATPRLKADTYTGTGNVNGGAAADGGGISSVIVSNDADNITFTINSTEAQASYIFYAIELQILGQAANGDTSLVNPWGEHLGISTGENVVINTYGTGATALTYDGAWEAGPSVSYDAGGAGFTFATITLPLSSLGLNVGDSFYFDVVSSYASNPDGQSAYGALDNTSYAAETDGSYEPWSGTNYYDSATDAGGTIFGTTASEFTIAAVPEPGIGALVCLSGLLAFTGRRIWKNHAV